MDIPKGMIEDYATADARLINDIMAVYASDWIPESTIVAMDPSTNRILGVIRNVEEEKLSFEF